MSKHTLIDAKEALDHLIKKSRVHLYKPIQIAEILYQHRTTKPAIVKLNQLETYRNPSKKWRDIICRQFLGRVSTSSAKFQDNLFEKNAIPPTILMILAQENKQYEGIVEAYIYRKFEQKHLQLNNALNYCLSATPDTFELKNFLDQFWEQKGLKRSLDKIFEIVVYSLFETLTVAMEVKIDIYYPQNKYDILREFPVFAEKVLNLSEIHNRKTLDAHFHRVGVTNAADRGLDMYANFGSIVQVKHLSLDEDLAENVVTSITANRIIIVCKSAEKNIIKSLLTQIGWRSRLQAIITIDELIDWYTKAMTGKYSQQLAHTIINILSNEIKLEFPSVGNHDFQDFKKERNYCHLQHEFWN